ncbi:PREDICTED: probable cytochrome P450 49a1 [Nicrophorus vespilloides]|uniref:Probable cytochrome P450 49a1 n=1 Tax=Nicrophorus vespilloides TaxID=110193 RepID=A0ABM1LZX1_NICVS|nr:PREDICTED: probable cytochrome P450 49a1 [Nicrophorus vespilloides]
MSMLSVLKRNLSKSSAKISVFNVQSAPVVLNKCNNDNVEWTEAASYEDVPGPKPFPLLGNNWRFIPYIGNFQIEHIDKVSKKLHEKYGNVVKIGNLLGRPDMLFLFDPNDIEKIFRQEDVLPLRPSMPSLNYYKHKYKKDFFGDVGGVIAVHGDEWQTFRTKVNQVMMQPRVAKMYIKTIENTAKEFVARVDQLRDENDETPADFLNEIHKWSLESIAKVALDVRLGCFDENADPDTQRLIDAVNTFFINVPILELKIPYWRLFNTPTFKEYIKSLETIRIICLRHVTEAMNNARNKDEHEKSVLERVLQLDNDAKIATILAFDLFLVGIDTTSNAVASILYQLALHPEKQSKLHSEISSILCDGDDELDANKLEKMSYLKAVIKETLRMYPVVIGNGRCTTKDCVVGGYQIPKGVQVVFQHYVISNMEKYFKRSDEFLPERWLKSGCPVGLKDNHHNFASLPFGFGRRMCLGRRFAELEIQTVIAKIVQSYKLEYNYQKLDYHIHPMYTPDGPLKIKFTKRN